ncbi:hypothetical protein FPV67DRAFT_379044 [Lyophyllum atratum]|nr:hypothetical protein FPV67DRAFT_379044 [Lyophyllum atratum]
MAERTRSVLRKNLVLEEKLEKLNATCPAPSPANAKMDDIVARLDALTTAFAEEKSKNADLESKNADLEARMDDFNRKNSALTDRVDGLENENIELKAEVQRHTPVLHALHRRVVLDRAKEMLLDDCTLARQVFPNAQAAITAVRNSCSARGVTRLSGPALEMVFAPGVIRAKGNSAAHTASPNDVSLAVLGSDLPPAQQKMLGEIYKYVYDKEPSLDL